MTKKENTGNPMPHCGQLLKQAFDENGMTNAELARRMNLNVISFLSYFGNNSLQIRTLWNAGLAFERNLIAQIGDAFPVPYQTKREKELEEKLENVQNDALNVQNDAFNTQKELQEKIDKLQLELDIYKRIMDKPQ